MILLIIDNFLFTIFSLFDPKNRLSLIYITLETNSNAIEFL